MGACLQEQQGEERMAWLHPGEEVKLEMNRGCPSSALSLQNPALSPLRHSRVVKDCLGPAVLRLLGGIQRKDGKNIAASARF